MTERDVGAALPTILLIGGPMTVDDGSRLDSRQPIEGDPRSQVTRKSLATSWHWWVTASSLVLPLLESSSEDAFALVIGQRSVVDLRSDGAVKRSGLRSFLRGGVGTISLVRTSMDDPLPDGYHEVTTLRNWNGQSLGTVGLREGKSGQQRWRLLDGNDYYLTFAAEQVGAAVVVDTGDSIIGGEEMSPPSAERFESFERARMLRNGAVLVLPHTYSAAKFIDSYVTWVQQGRPNTPSTEVPTKLPVWDLAAPPDPIRYTHPVPVEAEFQVTGMVEGGEWRDPSDLEAARSLLQARFDLKLGIWDLVRNPLLRRTLLDSKPVGAPPGGPVSVPVGAAERATFAVAKKVDRDAQAAAALKALRRELKPLEAIGWTHLDAGQLRFPLTEPLRKWPSDEEPMPLVWLLLTVTKQQTRVSVGLGMYNDVDLRSYVAQRRDQLEQIAQVTLSDPDRSSPVLWSAEGGWAADIEWSARAQELANITPAWESVFADIANECRRIQAERFAGVSRGL